MMPNADQKYVLFSLAFFSLASKKWPILSNKRLKILVHPIYTLQKPNMTMENPPIEDVFPIAILGFFQCQLQFSGVYVLSFQFSGFFSVFRYFQSKKFWHWAVPNLKVLRTVELAASDIACRGQQMGPTSHPY